MNKHPRLEGKDEQQENPTADSHIAAKELIEIVEHKLP
jgi:hypothetical protein